MEHPWLFDRCREVQAEPDNRLDLWAREHRKSSIITFGKTIQDILASHGDEPSIPNELTFGLFSCTRPRAKAFLRQIMTEFQTNEYLKATFPDVLYADPKNEAPKWSEDDGITVKRKGNPKEQTIEAWGLMDGQPTGPHYWRRVYDDTVVKASVSNADMIAKTTEAWELSLALGIEGQPARYVGTFYSLFDTYHTMIERGIRPRIYPATKDGSDNCAPANCVLMSSEVLLNKLKEMGSSTFHTQMLLNPKGGLKSGFDLNWLKWWPAEHTANLSIAIIVDPASKKKKTSDFTSIWVIGLGADENWYVIDHLKDRMNLSERTAAVFALHRRWRGTVFYEEYGMQADIEHIQYVQNQQNYRFTITPLGGQIAKEDRIKRLQPLFEQGRIFLPEGGRVHTNHEGRAVDTIQAFIKSEYSAFPLVINDDGLDSLARIEDEDVKANVQAPSATASSGRANGSLMAELVAQANLSTSRGRSKWMGK